MKKKSIVNIILTSLMIVMIMPLMTYAVGDAAFDVYKANGGTKYTVEKDADCEHGTYLKVSYKHGTYMVESVFEDTDIERAISEGCIKASGKNYYVAKTNALVPYIPALGHDMYSVTVDRTCGSKGYTYDICSRCKKTMLPKDAKNTDKLYVNALKTLVEVYDVKAPFKYEGARCTFGESVVIREATPYQEGLKGKICTECGAVDESTKIIIPKTEPTGQDIPYYDETVAAADKIINTPAKYTTDSVQAVIEAKAALMHAVEKGVRAEIEQATSALKAAVGSVKLKKSNTIKVTTKTVKAKAKK